MKVMNGTVSKRIAALDGAKGLGILLILWAHVCYADVVQTVAYSFHIPLFFLLSGMVYDPTKYASFPAFLKRRWKTLLLPYLLFGILSVFVGGTLQRLIEDPASFRIGAAALQAVRDLCELVYARGSAYMQFNSPLWFVPCLFAVEIIYYFLAKQRKWIRCAAVLLLTALGWWLESDSCPIPTGILPWSLDSALFSLGFYAVGNMIRTQRGKLTDILRQSKWRIPMLLLITLGCMLLVVPAAYANGKVSIGSKLLGNGFLFYFTGILGSIAVLSMGELLSRCPFLTYCGRNSFSVMAIHVVVITLLYTVMIALKLPFFNSLSFGETLLPTLVVLAITLLLTEIYRRIRKQSNNPMHDTASQ